MKVTSKNDNYFNNYDVFIVSNRAMDKEIPSAD